MKPFNLNTITLCLLLLAALTLSGCIEKPGSYINAQISAGKRDDFHAMNQQALKYIKSDNMDTLGYQLSKELLEDAATLRKVELISNQLKSNDYSLYDEYYLVKDTTNADSTTRILSPNRGANSYRLAFTAPPGETYIALFMPTKGDNKDVITLMYYKYAYGWKVSEMDMGTYTLNGKTAPEFYEFAKAEFAKKYMVNALNALQLANACLKPSQFWQYADEDKIAAHYTNLLDTANSSYKFPLVLTQIATHPKILTEIVESQGGRTYPVVTYLSSIKLQDTVAIKKENESIRAVLTTLMPGINKDKKMLMYSAYNEKPSAEKSVPHFDMMEMF